jgi:hypothetical protein
MNVPILKGLTDLVYLENAITTVLLDDPRMVCPVIPEVKLVAESDQSVNALWTLPRSCFQVTPNGVQIVSGGDPGPVGAGLMIEMPQMTATSPNVSGPPATWDISIVAFEERNTNFTSGTGTGITSEQYCELIIDNLQLFYFWQYGAIKVKQQAITPAHDWMGLMPGIFANRANFEATVGRKQTQRTLAPQPTISNGMCSITNPDPNALVFYTTDLSAPCQANINSANPPGIGATLYTAPFAVTSGTTVLTAARNFTNGYTLSAVNGLTAP